MNERANKQANKQANKRSAWVLMAVAAASLAAVLSACTGIRSVTSDVASYGDWPAGRKPTTYAFERLPSQQSQADAAMALEAAATPALAKAGFSAAAVGQEPEVLVQVGARTTRSDRSPWAEPLWWRGGFGYWRYSPWVSPAWGWPRYDSQRYDSQRYDTEVAVLLRDRATGKPLFESRASTDSLTRSDYPTLTAMFDAALADFPRLGINPRRVTTTIAP